MVFKSVNLKVVIISFLMIFITFLLFTLLIFENQIDLAITAGSLRVENETIRLIRKIQKDPDFNQSMSDRDLMKKMIARNIMKEVSEFACFNLQSSVFFKSDEQWNISSEVVMNGIRSAYQSDLFKTEFMIVPQKNSGYHIYIPLAANGSETVLFLNYKDNAGANQLQMLIRFIIIGSLILAGIHLVYYLLLYGFLLKPLLMLSGKMKSVIQGKFESLKTTKRFDEIGILISAYNRMIQEIDDKITSMNQEIIRRKETEAKLEELLLTDVLTGIGNKRYFNQKLSELISSGKRYNREFCLCIFDIDHFKKINDNYGHDTGDLIIGEIAQIAKKMIRVTDFIARWGGEEFVILFTDTHAKKAEFVVERIREQIEQNIFSNELKVTASFGISQYLEQDDENSLMKRADEALYMSKRSGRNRLMVL